MVKEAKEGVKEAVMPTKEMFTTISEGTTTIAICKITVFQHRISIIKTFKFNTTILFFRNTIYTTTEAVAYLVPASGNVTGTIKFHQPIGGVVTVNGTVYGLGSSKITPAQTLVF